MEDEGVGSCWRFLSWAGENRRGFYFCTLASSFSVLTLFSLSLILLLFRSCVLSVDMPNTIDDYVHRIGRTGRCGNTVRCAPLLRSLVVALSVVSSRCTQHANTSREEGPPFMRPWHFGFFGGVEGCTQHSKLQSRAGASFHASVAFSAFSVVSSAVRSMQNSSRGQGAFFHVSVAFFGGVECFTQHAKWSGLLEGEEGRWWPWHGMRIELHVIVRRWVDMTPRNVRAAGFMLRELKSRSPISYFSLEEFIILRVQAQ